MYRRIVVTLDGSARSEAALPHAAAVASAARAPLELVHVHVPWMPEAGFAEAAEPWLRPPEEPHPDVQFPDLPHPTTADMTKWLEGLAAEVVERTGASASARLLEGPLMATLGHYIRESEVDLLVMATRGQSGSGPAWLGSVAQSFAEREGIPLLLVPLPAQGDANRWKEASVRRLLVALDGSAASEAVLGPAMELAAVFGAAVRLLLVLPLGSGAADRRAAETSLASVAAGLPTAPNGPELEIAVHGQPAAAILHAVRSEAVDVVAAASHGESGIARGLLRGAAQEMLRSANVPLLLVRP